MHSLPQILIVTSLFLVACSPREALPPTEAVTLNPTEILTATSSASPAPTPTPTATEIPRQVVDAAIQVDGGVGIIGWSPDSKWLAYWTLLRPSNPDDPVAAILSFMSLAGVTCTDPGAVSHSPWLTGPKAFWQVDGSIIALTDSGPNQGLPCEDLRPVEADALPDPNSQTSPDGRTAARLKVSGEDQIDHNTVTLTDTTSGRILKTFSWSSSIFGQPKGPRWLNNDLYIIGPSFEQGVLYYSVPKDQIGEVGRDIFHEEAACLPENTQCWIFTYSNPQTGNYHILLASSNLERPMLYHSENSEVEDILFDSPWPFHPMSDLWGFSEDGQWLLGFSENNPFVNGPGEGWQVRPVDPLGSTLILVNQDAPHAWGDLSLETGRAALWDLKGVYIYAFPHGGLLETCVISAAEPQGAVWSPDAKWLAVSGYVNDTGNQMIIALCQE